MKDAVCSPGGTTIVGVAELERRFRGAVIDAVDAIQNKSNRIYLKARTERPGFCLSCQCAGAPRRTCRARSTDLMPALVL
ncbi:MAG: pyrroline-5-carboxylate reductase dimerization domain-containing protein [Alistipes finegoldii]